MDEILEQIGDTIGGFFESPIVQFALQAMLVYFVVVWLAAAYWAFRDMQLRTENPVLPYLAASFIIVFNFFFPLAIIVYRIVRPHEKIGETYERDLAEQALLAEVESIKSCPGCGRRTHDDWIICPSCRTRLNRVCPNCSRLVGLDWSLCAWCGKDFERQEAPVAAAHTMRDTDELGRLTRPVPPARPAGVGPASAPAPRTMARPVSQRALSGPTGDPLGER